MGSRDSIEHFLCGMDHRRAMRPMNVMVCSGNDFVFVRRLSASDGVAALGFALMRSRGARH
jgi:hypothetical protein